MRDREDWIWLQPDRHLGKVFEAPSNEVYSCTKKESLADSENPDIIGSTVPVKPILKCENSSKLYSLSSIANQLVTQEGQGLILSVVFNISFCLIKQFYLIKEKWETTSKMGEHNCSSIKKCTDMLIWSSRLLCVLIRIFTQTQFF